jgi:hypothetical protein
VALAVAETAVAGLGRSTLAVDPQAELAALNARLEAERKKAAEESPLDTTETPTEPEGAAPGATPGAGPSGQAAAGPADEGGGLPALFIVIIALFVLGTLGGAVFALTRRRARDPRKFFEGQGRLQRNFWALADADPEHFKYVAYRFPTMDEARGALLQLSFISEGPDNQLRCSRELEFGFYPHQDRWVSFVGGTDMHYALWREASAVLPELPQAEYFRVSTAPEVKLEVPDIGQLLRDEALKIEHVENREGEGDDFSQYYVYRAPDKQSALEFLKRANVSEAGVHVVVQTPDGTWGKDENGIYEE